MHLAQIGCRRIASHARAVLDGFPRVRIAFDAERLAALATDTPAQDSAADGASEQEDGS